MLCQVAPERYAEQLVQKIERLQTLLPVKTQCQLAANTQVDQNDQETESAQLAPLINAVTPAQTSAEDITLQIFTSPAEHFRARVEFRVWHEGERTNYVMFDQASKQRVNITHCPMALAQINDLMPQLMHTIEHTPVLRHKLFQVDFLATLSGQMLVSLIYRTPIQGNQAWLEAAQNCRHSLPIDHIIGRARKQKVVLDQDFVTETLQVDGQTFAYQQIENSFTQPNPYMAQNMLHWTRQVARNTLANPGDLIELYCGNGHFSIALAAFYNRVLATEISKTSVASAQHNCVANQVDNVMVVKMAAEEISQAMHGEREFFRLREVNLTDYNFTTIFVDPPRAGLDDLTRHLASQFEHIIYVSCNPQTLHRDLQTLLKTHQLVDAALFDQFPYTDHIESGVSLLKRPAL